MEGFGGKFGGGRELLVVKGGGWPEEGGVEDKEGGLGEGRFRLVGFRVQVPRSLGFRSGRTRGHREPLDQAQAT